jgi:NAD(P)-dependent dehydrogenase (short-subunit alcohol dehydrogenase family)
MTRRHRSDGRSAAGSQLTGRTAVVTGAANGIGLSLADQLARGGMNLALADVDAAQRALLAE